MSGVDLDRPWQFMGPDGVRYWSGVLRTGMVLEVVNQDSSDMTAGEAVIQGNWFGWPRWDQPANIDPRTPRLYGGMRVANATDQPFIGVTMESIPQGKTGPVLGRGSLCCVKSLTAASLSYNTSGAVVFGSNSQGCVDCQQANFANSGRTLGMVLAYASLGSTGSGSLTQLGIEVNPA